MFICRIGEYNGNGSTNYTNIISAQTELCQENNNFIMATTTLASMKERGLMKDDFHYYQKAYNEMGEFSAVNVAEYLKTLKEPTMYDPKFDNLYYSKIN